MFSERIDVEELREDDLSHFSAVRDINELLKQQNSRAVEVTREQIIGDLKTMKIAVAWHDGRIIGMGVLVRSRCVSNSFAGIHNLIVKSGYENRVLTIGKSIINMLTVGIFDVAYIEAGVWLPDNQMGAVLEALSFEPRHETRYRLRIPPP